MESGRLPQVITPTQSLPIGELGRLREMLEERPKGVRKTVLTCWATAYVGDPAIPGIADAAWRYATTRNERSFIPPEGILPFTNMKPHLVEKELKQVARDARSLISRLVNLRPDSRDLIESWLGEDDPWWSPEPKGLLDLRELAQDMDKLAKWAEDSKQNPNGRREGFSGRLPPVEQLVFDIGRMISFHDGKVSHTLPIARVVHKWATGEDVIETKWGGRPFENVRPSLKALDWSQVSAEERIAPLTLPDDSGTRK